MKNDPEQEVWVLLENQRTYADLLVNAAALARLMNATLQGLFIEEENLIRAAEFSFSREISSWSAQESEISGDIIQRSLQANARHNKRQLETVARDNNIQCSFQVVQGERMSWILENANTPRILFIAGKRNPLNYYRHLHYCNFNNDPVVLLYNGSDASERALKIALQMSELTHSPLVILVLAVEAADNLALTTQVNESLNRETKAAVSIQYANNEQLLVSLHSLRAAMFVYPDEIKLEDDGIVLKRIVQQVRCPVVLIQ